MVNIEKILEELKILPEFGDNDQIMLQTVEGQIDPFYGIGRLEKLNHTEDEFKHPIFDMPYTNGILKDLKMFRTRVMKMPSRRCYSYHKDPSKRMHIPLITNENCFFVLDDEVVRLPADGNHYIIDTTKMHTFVNASLEERIHIVGCI